MRQIFTSQRLETVEGVARLLEEHGVETYTSNGRSFRGQRRGGFSYTATRREPQPGVWIVRADQIVQAREILREARLLESTRVGSFLPSGDETPAAADAETPRTRLVTRLRLALIAMAAIMAAVTSVRMLAGV
jgi:hypothetical protein